MSYHRRASSKPYLVIRKQGNYPVRIVRHSLAKRKAEREAQFLQEQLEPRKDIKFEVREEGWNRKRWHS